MHPVVFSSTGGMGKHAKALYNRIASLLADKSREAYRIVNAWIRCKLTFALLRASVVYLRGSRGPRAPTLSTSESAKIKCRDQMLFVNEQDLTFVTLNLI